MRQAAAGGGLEFGIQHVRYLGPGYLEEGESGGEGVVVFVCEGAKGVWPNSNVTLLLFLNAVKIHNNLSVERREIFISEPAL